MPACPMGRKQTRKGVLHDFYEERRPQENLCPYAPTQRDEDKNERRIQEPGNQRASRHPSQDFISARNSTEIGAPEQWGETS